VANPNRVDQVNAPDALRGLGNRVGILEADVGRWSYVIPIAPATDPADYFSGDPLLVPFQNGWANVAGMQPLRFRIHPATKVEIQGAVTGGTPPSILFTLPLPLFFPPKAVPILFPSTDQLAVWSGRIDTNGDVWIVEQVVVSAPPAGHQYATYSASITVASGGAGPVTPWVYNGNPGETDLFDLTSPGAPAARTAGVYAISIYATSHSAIADKAFDLEMDVNTADSFFTASDFPLDGSNVHPGPYGAVYCPAWVMAAGDTWDAGISHLAGAPITFDLGAYVMKLG
jgi:hypothetical protein